MEPDGDGGNHMFGILLVSEQTGKCWNEGGHTGEQICQGTFEDSHSGAGAGELAERLKVDATSITKLGQPGTPKPRAMVHGVGLDIIINSIHIQERLGFED